MLKNAILRVAAAKGLKAPSTAVQRLFSTKPATIIQAAPKTAFTTGPAGVRRPISPELAIWKFSPAAYAHVGVRITGCVLAGIFTVAGLLQFLPVDSLYVIDVGKTHAPFLVPFIKAAIVFPLAYHYFGGARQLFQDFGARGYTHKFHNASSIAMVGFAVAATALLSLYTHEPKAGKQ